MHFAHVMDRDKGVRPCEAGEKLADEVSAMDSRCPSASASACIDEDAGCRVPHLGRMSGLAPGGCCDL